MQQFLIELLLLLAQWIWLHPEVHHINKIVHTIYLIHIYIYILIRVPNHRNTCGKLKIYPYWVAQLIGTKMKVIQNMYLYFSIHTHTHTHTYIYIYPDTYNICHRKNLWIKKYNLIALSRFNWHTIKSTYLKEIFDKFSSMYTPMKSWTTTKTISIGHKQNKKTVYGRQYLEIMWPTRFKFPKYTAQQQ